ncbi:hypothetical protein [Bradyrhizobium sp. WSM471]|uniref:hypothetical protein n=1 Tax=Bradyrhizobium sp. WSM471 TaxID=319017 RepID=UPI00024D237D|nr:MULTISPECIES: hypothetical protein [Bradyrhizobium]EHR01450.1 hypothetical protein Bra471DRAFT_02178 [Bradyrhizobium sp. WSM471]UFW43505.1 hypothetical protein BcanWSM471_10695 [Bradyrhizobium canariense]
METPDAGVGTIEVILLGTGGPRPDPRRMATTTLIRLRDENILFDAGRGVMVLADVRQDYAGPVVLGEDLTRIEV